MKKFDLKGRTVTVVGLAKSGISAALLLRAHKATVRATDAKPADQLGDAPAILEKEKVELHLGGHTDAAIDGADLVVTSPGVPEDAAPLARARAKGIEILGELELAWRLLPKGCDVIAITGSNGKSTTTSLTAHLLSAAGHDTWAGGNLGTPLSELVRSGSKPRFAVVEVSSFMLETTSTFAPEIAAILNVSANHLDRHPSLDAYAQTKARIWKNANMARWAVFNGDDEKVASLVENVPGLKIAFRAGEPPFQGAGYSWSANSSRVDLALPAQILEAQGLFESKESYSLAAFPAPGAHNAANAAAAILMARIAGARAHHIEPALATFAPLEHRLEKCGEAKGIRFFNDSKATTSEALAKSIAVFEKGVVVLAGGKDKGGNFVALRPLFQTRVKKLVTFGTAKDLIADALEGTTNVLRAENLTAAFAEATKRLGAGDVVLFSPACASYDQFANFEERGRAFKALAKEWTEARA